MNFIIKALSHNQFETYFDQSDSELKKMGIKRMFVNEKPGFPCRVSLEDAEIGEEVILLSHEFHKTNSPYQSQGPIFVRKGVKTKELNQNEIPVMLNHRLLSFRGYNKNGFMKEATTAEGVNTNKEIQRMLENSDIEYIHIHNSSPGCYNCEVIRV